MHAVAHGGVRTPCESALQADSRRKIPCSAGESNLRRRCAFPMLYQLSYIPLEVVQGYDSSRGKKVFVLFSVVVWHCIASVIVSNI